MMLGVKTKVCLKPLKIDAFVSRKIDLWGSFEGKDISVLLKGMYMYPEAVFLDIGSNIGIFSAVMAAAGRNVVAVDAMLTNLAYLFNTLSTCNTTNHVRLLHNPVR